MKMTLSLLSGMSALAFAVPATAQHEHHGAQTAPAAAAEAFVCTAEHAAMGHCVMEAVADPKADVPDHGGHGDHVMPGLPADHAGHGAEAAKVDPDCAPEHAAMGHCTPKTDTAVLPQIGTNQPAGDAPAPPPPAVWMADAIWGGGAMAHSRHQMMVENGGQTYKFLRLDAEYIRQKGKDGASWAAEFWYGGDINRLTVRSDGEAVLGEGLEEADIQLLYSRAVDAYFNVQAGVRQDLVGDHKRSYATIGFEGLAPYWFEVEGAMFLSDKGEVTAHLEAEYDQRLTQKWVLQPAFEVGFSAQNVTEKGLGSGITDVSAGLRLRYEFVRAFAPYVGVEWSRKLGGTARYARAYGHQVEATNFVFGLKSWF